jgi:hypothetical protein
VNGWSLRPDVVPVVVTAVGANGRPMCYFCDLRRGPDGAGTVELPDGTVVTIERPLRERVDFGQLRAHRRTDRLRPSWRDDSELFMWLRFWRAQRDGRRAIRAQHRHLGRRP